MRKADEERIREFLGRAVGEASICWGPMPGTSIFDSSRASKIVDRLFSLFEENIEAEKTETERERMRLAACGVAALGYFTDCHEDYKSASLKDILRLYAENEKYRKALVYIAENSATHDDTHYCRVAEEALRKEKCPDNLP